MAVPMPPPPPSGSLRERIEWLLERMFTKLYNVLIGPIGDRLRMGVDNFLEQMESAALSYVRPVIGRIRDAPGIPAEWKQLLDRVHDPQEQLEIGAVLGVAVGLLIGIVQGAIQPIARIVSYFVERLVQTGRPDPVSLFQMHRRGAFDQALRDSYLDDLGVSDHLKTGFRILSQVRPGVSQLLTLWLRGHISETELHERLQQEGVGAAYLADIKRLAEQLPGPGDLVRFALREAWRDDIAELYGYDADYVSEFGQWMEKLGYSADWARKYWRAHWELPSITLGAEMVHRGIISEHEFDDLLRVQDLPSGWRSKVVRTIYSPYTRVDARRMHAFGVLSDDELVDVYKSQGYDEAHAQNMALFTIRYNASEDRELTKTDVLNGYRDGILSAVEAGEMLESLGYSPETVAFLIARVDATAAKKLVDAEVGVIKDLYVNGDLTQAQAQERLTALGLPARQIELLLQEWTITRQGKTQRPSRATLERMFANGAITQEQFVTTLAAIGYQEQYIGWYLENMAIEQQIEAEKEAERVRKEQERVEKLRRATEYQKAKAAIDVEIAETQAEIASVNVARVDAENSKAEALRALPDLAEQGRIERDYMTIAHDADAAIGEAQVLVSELREQERGLRLALADIDQSLATNVDVARQVEIRDAVAAMRVSQATFRDTAAALRVEQARVKELAATETDETLLEQYALDLLSLKVQEAEANQAVTDIEIDVKTAEAELGATMSAERRQELLAEQAAIRLDIATVAEQIAGVNSEIAEASTAKTNARNEMTAALAQLPGALEQLEIRKHWDNIIERLKAQGKALQAAISDLRVRKALLALEYREGAG